MELSKLVEIRQCVLTQPTEPLPPLLVSRCMRFVQEDEKAVKAFGVEHGTETCKALLAAGAPGLHFYTLNLEKVGGNFSENANSFIVFKCRTMKRSCVAETVSRSRGVFERLEDWCDVGGVSTRTRTSFVSFNTYGAKI